LYTQTVLYKRKELCYKTELFVGRHVHQLTYISHNSAHTLWVAIENVKSVGCMKVMN